MAINQTVLMPQRKNPFDTLLKGLQVAQGIFGIKTALEQSSLTDLQKKQLEQQQLLDNQALESKKLDYEKQKRLSDMSARAIWDPKDFNNDYYAVDDDKVQNLSKKFGDYPFQTVRIRVFNPNAKDQYDDVIAISKDQIKEAQKALDNARKAKIAETIANNQSRPKPNANTFSAANYANRMAASNKILDDLERDGFDRSSFETVLMNTITKPLGEVGEFFRNPDLKLYDQASRNFINAILRDESGAAIGQDEFRNATLQYFPVAGDTPAVKEQKRQNRLMVQKALEDEARYGLTGDVVNVLRDHQNRIRGFSGAFDPGKATTDAMMLDMYQNQNQNQNNESNYDPAIAAWLDNYTNSR